jgi:GTP diphosphokinase / guanosine-3',5'-bis(diphosphate) 3'-diphosphatase
MGEATALFKEWSGYLKPEDITQLQTAYHFSEAAHQGQFRQSGEPYITHPLAVANILAQWHLDSQALTAALLHDVMEDTAVTKSEISRNFGKPVAELVDGVSKLDRIEFETQEKAQAENFRKMLLAMARDVRVILIKLADRLHNMRTLEAVEPTKRRRIARETLDIYAPIANRLGLNSIYQELEDLSFKHLYPDRYRVLAKAVKAARGNRREVVGKVLESIKRRLRENKLEAEVHGREKHLYSIYRKMREKRLSFAQVLDVFGFRVVVKDVHASYIALGALHGLFKPIPGKFKDYIAIPKANGYQSLHTTLFGPFGIRSRRRSAPPKCTRLRRRASLRTGSTRVSTLHSPTFRRRRTNGCRACFRCSRSRATRPNFSNISKSIFFPTRFICSRPAARSWHCRAGQPQLISPMRCTPTSATAASRSKSTRS